MQLESLTQPKKQDNADVDAKTTPTIKRAAALAGTDPSNLTTPQAFALGMAEASRIARNDIASDSRAGAIGLDVLKHFQERHARDEDQPTIGLRTEPAAMSAEELATDLEGHVLDALVDVDNPDSFTASKTWTLLGLREVPAGERFLDAARYGRRSGISTSGIRRASRTQ